VIEQLSEPLTVDMRQSIICHLSTVILNPMRDVDESLPVGKWAYGLMFAFLACLGGISIAIAADWENRQELERVSQPTAVGDAVVVGFDSKPDQVKEVLRWKGVPYYPVQNGVTLLPEYNALKIGLDDSSKIWLYREKHPGQENQIVVKIGANQFLRIAPK
jgi:hypothetical protein